VGTSATPQHPVNIGHHQEARPLHTQGKAPRSANDRAGTLVGNTSCLCQLPCIIETSLKLQVEGSTVRPSEELGFTHIHIFMYNSHTCRCMYISMHIPVQTLRPNLFHFHREIRRSTKGQAASARVQVTCSGQNPWPLFGCSPEFGGRF
jgi:hypothetical protein